MLTLKTYDPVSGVCLKYRTDKAAEVGRLVSSLGRLGKAMAGQSMEEPMAAAAAEPDAISRDGAATSDEKPKQQNIMGQASTGGAGGTAKKKRKGKK